jgi:NAD(P)-dependent dehydrogenase (short-subunit alcohol dehydrogenase family)
MKKSIVVIGATGDVGSGIVKVLLHRGHRVAAAARNPGRLDALLGELRHSANLHAVPGSVDTDEGAAALLRDVRMIFPAIDAVIVSVNTPRRAAPLLTHSSDSLTALIRGDLIAHYAAARAFIPALTPAGVLIGIGGGSCDFILRGGVPQSVGQAGLRMLYRGLAHELADAPVYVRQLIIASIVNGTSTRDRADPQWVTDAEIGEQAAAIVENPGAFPGPILRLARRDSSGRPVFSAEAPTRVQGFS